MPVAIIAAGVAAAGAVGGAVISSSATSKAANAAKDAAAANNSLAASQYATNSANLNPAIERGNQAGGYINSLLMGGGDQAAATKAFDTFQNSTGYQYQLAQGLGAVNSNAYARGMGDSGATLKALQTRGNNLADQSFQSYIGNLQNVSQQGTAAASSLAGVGTQYVAQTSANNNAAADATGNAALTNASNINGTINNLINAGAYAYGSSYGSKTPSPAASGLVAPSTYGRAASPYYNYIGTGN